VTGYVVDTMDEAHRALGKVLALDRSRVRRRFEERFSVSRMAKDYLRIYERQIGTGKEAEETATPAPATRTNGAGRLSTR